MIKISKLIKPMKKFGIMNKIHTKAQKSASLLKEITAPESLKVVENLKSAATENKVETDLLLASKSTFNLFHEGETYEFSTNGENNFLKAIECYEKAREEGFVGAEYSLQRIYLKLGKHYEYGFRGFEKNLQLAIRYYEKAKERGDYDFSDYYMQRVYSKLSSFSDHSEEMGILSAWKQTL